MKKDTFFGFLGRANTLILFFCGLGILGIMGYTLYQEWGDYRYRRNHHGPTWTSSPVAGEIANRDSLLFLGEFEASKGTSWVYTESWKDRPAPWKKKGGTHRTRVNYLFLDIDTGETRWLKPTNTGSINIMREDIGRRFDWGESQMPFHLYRVKEKDTNGDGKVDLFDDGALAISALDGSNYHILFEGYGHDKFLERNNAGNIILIHQQEETLWMAEIDTVTLALIKHEKVDAGQAFNTRE